MLTPEYFLAELQKLNQHLAAVDVYRMNKQLLHEYLLFLLTDDKAALLIQKGSPDNISSITREILKATSYLPAYFALPVLEKLIPVAKDHESTGNIISQQIIKIKKEEKLQKAYPWLIVLITILILIAMYYFSKK